MESLEGAGEDSKCDIVHQLLCMACLGPGQTLHVLKHQALQLYNTTVNSGQQLVHNVSPRVCWECEILLKKVMHFRERVTGCHDILNSSHVKWSEVMRQSRLQKTTTTEIDIQPLDIECSMLEVKQEIEEQKTTTTEIDIQPLDIECSMLEVKQEIEEQKTTTTEIDIPPLNIECSMLEVKQEIEEQKTTTTEIDIPPLNIECSMLEVKQEIEEQKTTTTEIDIPPLDIECSMLEVKQEIEEQKTTTTDIDIPPLDIECSMLEVKQEIEEVQQREPSATEESQPCTACLCGGRRLNNIRDKELKYYTGILNQKMVVSAVSPQLCWECCCILRQATHFGEIMRQSYETIIPSLLTADIQDITSLLCSGVSLPLRLRRCVRDRVDIPPYAHTHDPPPPVKLEPGSLGLGDSSPPPAGHEQRIDEPATEVKHTSRRDTTHVTTSNITSDRRHRECTSKQQLISNMYPHNTSVCEDNSHVCVESALQDTRIRKQGVHKQYQCNHCSKMFRYKSYLIRHVRTHTAENYQCPKCSRDYTWKQSLVLHMKTHDGDNPYQCSQCLKAYYRKHDLVLHMMSHGAKRPYQCSQCSKALTTKHHLALHMITHSKEKRYQCSQCTKAYASKRSLVYHMISHSGEKPYSCSQCSKVTTYSGEKPYQCSQCSKADTYKNHLARHMTTYSGKKPYQCSQCSKAFYRKDVLVNHMTTHSADNTCQRSQS